MHAPLYSSRDSDAMIWLTIVTATYNRRNKLARTIRSVQAQTVQKIEHIIVDNMSQDGTEQLVKDYQEKANYPIIYIRERDTGIYNAINKGIKRARGKWIHILHSDDAYYSDRSIENMIDNKYDPFDVLCGAILKDTAGEVGLQYYKPYFDENLKTYYFPHPGTVIKRDFYKIHGNYDERFKIISDTIFNVRNYPKAKYRVFDEILVIMDGSGLSNQLSVRGILELYWLDLIFDKSPLFCRLKLAISQSCDLFNKKFQLTHKLRLVSGIFGFELFKRNTNQMNYAIPVWWNNID